MAQNRCSFVRAQCRPVFPRLSDAQVAANLAGTVDARTGDVLSDGAIREAMDVFAAGRRLAERGRELTAHWQEEDGR